jgi:hypothetical protein
MKTLIAVATMALGFAASGMAAEVKGFVQDASCSTKAAMKGNSECSKKCIKGGDPAVLVAENGTIYKIANQDKIVSHAGENVTVTGNVKGDTITVESVK